MRQHGAGRSKSGEYNPVESAGKVGGPGAAGWHDAGGELAAEGKKKDTDLHRFSQILGAVESAGRRRENAASLGSIFSYGEPLMS